MEIRMPSFHFLETLFADYALAAGGASLGGGC